MSINKEKVRELAINLRKHNSSFWEKIIAEWLEQNQPETVIVGLSDVQVRELTTHFICEKPDVDSPKECHEVISNYLKTQTFAQPENLIVSNSTQLKPNWDDAPPWANWLAQDANGGWCWFEEKPSVGVYQRWTNGYACSTTATKVKNWQQTLEQRPTPPAPKVEVGQVWNHVTSLVFTVMGITDTNQIIAHCNGDNLSWEGTLEDFIAKFVLVGE